MSTATLQERLQEDLKNAMRKGDSARRSVIRMLRSEIHNQEIARQADLEDEAVIDVLGKQAQQRRDSIEAFEQGGRQDLVEKEQVELAIILEYLPDQMSAEDIADLARTAVKELGATSPQDMGKVMGRLMPQVRGRAEGRKVSRVVSELLKELRDQV